MPRARKPRALRVKTAEACPDHAVWVGSGSKWHNPFLRPAFAGVVAIMGRRMFPASEVIHSKHLRLARRLNCSETDAMREYLYERWIEGWDDRDPKFAELFTMLMGQTREQVEPPTIAEIRRELRGKQLASAAPARVAGIQVLLRIANQEEE